MSSFVSVALIAVLASSESGPNLTLERSVELALERNPGIQSARADVTAARARLEGASALLRVNPTLEGSAGPRRTPDGGSYTDLGLGLSQELEIFGQRGARIDSASALLASAEAALERQRVLVAAEVRESFARRLASLRRLQVEDEALALAEEALRAAEARQRSGAASRIEVNAARSLLGRALRERASAVQHASAAEGSLTILLGLDPAVPVSLEGELPTEIPEPAPLAELVERALAARPELRAARHELEAAQAEQRLAGREALPNPRLGVTYAEEGDAAGKTRITQGVLAFDLPLFARNQAGRGVAAARTVQAEQALSALTRAVHTEVAIARSRVTSGATAARAYAGGLLAGLEENMGLVNEAYRAGKVGFFELLVIRRETLDARIGYIDALEELQAARAQLSRAMGSIE